MGATTTIHEREPAARAGQPEMALSARHLHKTYRLGRIRVPVLHGVDIDVAEGEVLAVLGASGSGKSTLLHLLGGLDRPDRDGASGGPASITFRGRRVDRFGARDLDAYRSRDVGFVFQFYHLLPELTVLQNVVVGAMIRQGLGYSRAGATARARELLEAVGLSHRLAHRPAELSGGERQRVAIARALINAPALLLADEPTGNLDRETGRKILDMLMDLRARTRQTMVIVTHDQATAGRADRLVRLEDGRVLPA